MRTKIGILPMGRGTFDIDFATEKFNQALGLLDSSEYNFVGSRELLLENEATESAIESLRTENIDALLVLQITFTDSLAVVDAARRLGVPLFIWAIPEPRTGARLRLNAFCGLNLASHALGLNNIDFGWTYTDPESDCTREISTLLGSTANPYVSSSTVPSVSPKVGNLVLEKLEGETIACIGQHPPGFSTCQYNAESARELTGIKIETMPLVSLFESANKSNPDKLATLKEQLSNSLKDLECVNQNQLDHSLRLKLALDDFQSNSGYAAYAIRCWPETFTEYGGAVCGPASILGENKIPCACEADVYGAITQLILQNVAHQPVFLTDIVDLDATDDTGVVWHCGQAPISMANEAFVPRATIHTNRKMPLLYEFPLKPGRITMMRLSQARNKHQLVIATGEMLDRAMAFTGTSGVVRFDNGTETFMHNLIDERMEHHMALVYGDYADDLKSFAAAASLPLVEL